MNAEKNNVDLNLIISALLSIIGLQLTNSLVQVYIILVNASFASNKLLLFVKITQEIFQLQLISRENLKVCFLNFKSEKRDRKLTLISSKNQRDSLEQSGNNVEVSDSQTYKKNDIIIRKIVKNKNVTTGNKRNSYFGGNRY